MHIGVNIKKFRKEKGLSQTKLGELAELPRVSIGRYESGCRKPSIDIVKTIAEALDLTVQELVTGEIQEIKIVEKDITQFTTEELLKEIYRRTIMED